jgi:predicted TIM-barrel fold metal-dependent hydrolase
MGHRPIEDAVTSLCCHGVLHRFPRLKIALVENGSAWVRPILRSLADVYNKMPQELPEDPVDAFRRNLWIHPFHEEDPRGLVELLGADRVIFGSDYPHPEGMSDPLSYVDEIADLPSDDIERIMSTNMHELLGLTAAATA